MNSLQPVPPFDCEALRRQFPIFQRPDSHSLHYLDSAATAQIPRCVVDAMVAHEFSCRANVQRGGYRLAARATDAYEAARQTTAEFLNAASADEIVFTGGATAALNLLAFGLSQQLAAGDEILLSELEHHSNILPWREAAKRTGAVIRYLPVGSDGRLRSESIDDFLSHRTRVVSLSHCSNVTGAITDISAVVRHARRYDCHIVIDGAQQVPHDPPDMQVLGVDFYVFAGHKCYGPNGVGVLWGRQSELERLPPFLTGGGMVDSVHRDRWQRADGPRGFEAGTPPIAQVVGLAAALSWMRAQPRQAVQVHGAMLRDILLDSLSSIPGIRLLSPLAGSDRQPLVSFCIDGIHAHDLCHVLDEQGVAVRGGAHCAELLMQTLGCDAAVRASIAPYNNRRDIDTMIAATHRAAKILG